jgi:hypothetical protein
MQNLCSFSNGAHLDAALVDVTFHTRDSALCRFAEKNHLLEQEYTTYRFPSRVPHDELVLSQQHSLFTKIHLKHDTTFFIETVMQERNCILSIIQTPK